MMVTPNLEMCLHLLNASAGSILSGAPKEAQKKPRTMEHPPEERAEPAED